MTAEDGLAARCVGRWSSDKLHYVRGYLQIFSRSMRNAFPIRHYVDLFAGPGRCCFDDGSGEIDGSPLQALTVEHPFTKYHLADSDPAALEALKGRIRLRGLNADVAFYLADANDSVEQVRAAVPPNALSVAVIDPTGLHLHFEALRRLVDGRRMDLIYLFPEGMAVKRNLERFVAQPQCRLDDVLGTAEWRRRIPGRLPDESVDAERHWESVGRPIVEVLKRQLVGLGYREIEFGSAVVVRNTRNVPLYYLVFASKAQLGHRFWDAIRRIDPTGQIDLPYGPAPRST